MKRKSNQRLHQRKRNTMSRGQNATSDTNETTTDSCFQSQQKQGFIPPLPPTYQYGFTNSELFAYIASLSPYELVTLETLVSILLQCHLNTIETKLLANLFIETGIIIGNIVEQEILQESLIEEQQAILDAYLDEQLGRTNVQLDQRVRELEHIIAQMQIQLQQLQSTEQTK